MTNESGAVIIELLGNRGDPIRYTVADGTAIDKGDILQLTNPRTASAVVGTASVAGIASADKVASDGSTTLALYTNGIFDLTNGDDTTITCGNMVCTSGANLIADAANSDATNPYISGHILGKALEQADADEVIAVRVLI